MNQPPSPPGLPLLGNALAYRRDPLAFLRRAARDHGPVVRIRLGPLRLYLLSDPADVERVLMESPEHFGKSALIRVLGRPLFGEALDALDGAAWAERRRLVAPAFRPACVGSLADGTPRHVQRVLDAWKPSECRRFDRDALRVMIQAGAEAITGAALSAEVADDAGRAMRDALAAFDTRVNLGLRTPDWLPLPHHRRLRTAMGRLHAIVRAITTDQGPPEADAADVFSVLRRSGRATGYSEPALVDELTIMAILGGHQLSLALTWAAYLLSTHEPVAARLRDEAEHALAGRAPTAADLPQLPYTAAVVDETLRLYPPFFMFVREALHEVDVGGYRLPAGATLVLSPWVTHRTPSLFDEPDAFRPERWLDGLTKRLPRGAYFPFGGGPRICIANQLARTQLVLALATICAAFRVRVQPGHAVTPLPMVGLGVRGGLPVTVQHSRTGAPSGDEAP